VARAAHEEADHATSSASAATLPLHAESARELDGERARRDTAAATTTSAQGRPRAGLAAVIGSRSADQRRRRVALRAGATLPRGGDDARDDAERRSSRRHVEPRENVCMRR
jgi:hypothetical protein